MSRTKPRADGRGYSRHFRLFGAIRSARTLGPCTIGRANLDGTGKDHIIPASTSKSAFKLQSKSKAMTELKEYPGRSHYIVGQPGWEEVADLPSGGPSRGHRQPPAPVVVRGIRARLARHAGARSRCSS